jgi:hypothetical protein
MSFLRGLKTTAIVISHEPYFLDAVATDIIMIKRKKLQIFEGNFSNFTRMQRDFTVSDLESSAANNAHDVLNFRFPDPGRPVGRLLILSFDVDFPPPVAFAFISLVVLPLTVLPHTFLTLV